MEIHKETSYMESDGLLVYYDVYKSPTNEHKGLVQICHGMVEHRGNYQYMIDHICKAGYIVAINDHRGHGDSVNNICYLGEMGENGFEKAFHDIYKLSIILKQQYKPNKFILIGHSMGSLIARRYLQEHEYDIDILVLCGTPSPHIGISVGLGILKMCNLLRLENTGRHLAYKASFIAFNSKYRKIDRLNNGKNSNMMWVNRDTGETKRHIEDARQNFIFTLNSFINLIHGLKRVFDPYKNKVNNTNLPILFISGEDDACGKFGYGALKAYKNLISNGYSNVKLILYAQARHELFLELNKDEVIEDLLKYIDNHL